MSTLKVAQEPMYLRGVEEDPKPSVYRDLIENAKSSGGDYWQIWHLLAFDPEAAHHLVALSHTLMHKPGPLSAGLREFDGDGGRQPRIERAGAQRAGDHKDFQRGHDFDRSGEPAALGARRYQPLRYTQTRAGGRFIQIRSEAWVDTPGSDFGIGGATE